MSKSVKNTVAQVFAEIADGLKTGSFGDKVVVGITLTGSEHGVSNIIEAAKMAAKSDASIEVVLIGKTDEKELRVYEADGQEEEHKLMDKLLDSGEIHACVTNHYNFPIGVSTVGRVVTPAKAKELIIATTTGTTATNRVEAMLKNSIAGIICAKSLGKTRPTVGILNVDGARGVEKHLKELQSKGYEFDFAESARSDGGAVMRGNDLLMGTPDVMVCDSLTGNILMKMFSSYTTGGSFESTGFGYGPGIGKGYKKNIFIISRASGAPVIANAILFAAETVKGGIDELKKSEYELVEKLGLAQIVESLNKSKEKAVEVKAPEKEIVTSELNGIDVMDLDDGVSALWAEGIYAESGMGCTGPIILVSDANKEKAAKILVAAGFLGADESKGC